MRDNRAGSPPPGQDRPNLRPAIGQAPSSSPATPTKRRGGLTPDAVGARPERGRGLFWNPRISAAFVDLMVLRSECRAGLARDRSTPTASRGGRDARSRAVTMGAIRV